MNASLVRRGAIAGMVGGAVMAMWSMVVLAATGAGFWQPLDLIAHTVWRGAPLNGTFSAGALGLGLVTHMVTSAMLGVAFAGAAQRLRAGGALAAGMGAGLGVWLVNQYAVWPLIDSASAGRFTPWVFALGHLMYGVATALVVLRLTPPVVALRRTASPATHVGHTAA